MRLLLFNYESALRIWGFERLSRLALCELDDRPFLQAISTSPVLFFTCYRRVSLRREERKSVEQEEPMVRNEKPFVFLFFCFFSIASVSLAYRPGDIVPMSKMGQYHSSRTVWHDVIGRQCPIFAVDREVLIPIAKPTGYTGADPYKISFQVGREKFLIPWLLVINRKSSEVPIIDVHLRYSGNDLLGVTARVIDMPHHYVESHQDIRTKFWDPEHWPKHILVRYTWEEQSEIDVSSGFYVLFGSAVLISFLLSIFVLQSSQDKLARFVRETVAESSMPGGGVAKVE